MLHSMRTVAVVSLLAACSGQDTGSTEQGASLAQKSSLEDNAIPGRGIGHVARVMTRNLYLGADLTPLIAAPDIQTAIAGAGAVLRQVDASNFPVRAKGLAAEILGEKPDLVGLQEVALWRTGPVSFDALTEGPAATTVRYDYLQLLLDQLNAGEEHYRPAIIEEEFDFEAPADEDGNITTGWPYGADINGRLTMRDVILERVDSGVRVSEPQGGHYTAALPVTLPIPAPDGGLLTIHVTRGWTKVDARVRGSLAFRFINTHFEAYNAYIAAMQAGELLAGPAGGGSGSLPVVLVGDLNSDDDTMPFPETLAYGALLGGGFVERSTNDPLSCCIHSEDLTSGTADEFDHQVDHIMTNAPNQVRLVSSSVTGREMVDGWWDSDHAGLFSALYVR